jgi:hypothetical protein
MALFQPRKLYSVESGATMISDEEEMTRNSREPTTENNENVRVTGNPT